MGFFRRNNQSAEELEQVRAQLTALREQLQQADRAKAELLTKLDTVDQTNAVLYQRIDAIDAKNNAFQHRLGEIDSATLHTVRAADDLTQRLTRVDQQMLEVGDRFGAVSDHINARDVGVDSLGKQVHELSQRLSTSKPAVPPPPPPAPAGPDARVTDLAQRLDDLAAAVAARVDAADAEPDAPSPADLEAMRSQLGQVAERMSSLDARMTNISVELANQLTELSDDLEVLIDPEDANDAVGSTAADLEALQTLVSERVDLQLGEMRSSAEHLAAEQARYQIQFREDLAELAERLRRPSAR